MLKIGIVGAGGMGTVHYSNYKHINDVSVAAVAGKTEQDRSRAESWGVPFYEDIGIMAQKENLDIVDVCTPTFLHKQHVVQALNAGCHVIVEKPVALNKADALSMFALAEEKGLILFVAQVLQFSKEIELLREFVKDGRYGKPLDMHFERLSVCPQWAREGWLFDKSKSGLIPYDLHIHDLDVIVSLLGKPKHVSFTSCRGGDKTYPEHYRFIYTYDNGPSVSAEAGWLNSDIPFTARWRVYFENAMVINDGAALTAYQFGTPMASFDLNEEIKIETGINIPPTGIFLSELKHFINCVTNGTPSCLVTKEQVLSVVEILEAMSVDANSANIIL
jgi:predicted dehydrogenase